MKGAEHLAAGARRFVDPASGDPLHERDGRLVDPQGRAVATIAGGIPRFVDATRHYAKAFGFQWKKWRTLSDQLHGGRAKYEEVLRRTRFAGYPTQGASVLECGMGGGDDTEVLLQLGFAEVHAFDLSEAVEAAAARLHDPRLTISQASIFEIPYADESFDFVFCHRVLQHTPDPARALRCVCRKVRPGGVLFAHSYLRTPQHMRCFKYKVRWLTKRLPYQVVYAYVRVFGPVLHLLNRFLYRFFRRGRWISYEWVPYYHYPSYADLSPERLRQLEALNTFDALTPAYDDPMTREEFTGIIESEGFVIEHLHVDEVTPIWCTAVKRPRS
jgi:ubiquinone/menaquinone biosynthesis C-methylase UbiE